MSETDKQKEPEATGKKAGKADPDPTAIWMKWTGPRGASTPPLPSHDLTAAYVLVYISSMEEAESYAQTGMWELKIPDGALRKTRPDVDQG